MINDQKKKPKQEEFVKYHRWRGIGEGRQTIKFDAMIPYECEKQFENNSYHICPILTLYYITNTNQVILKKN